TAPKLPTATVRTSWTLEDLAEGGQFLQQLDATLRRHLGAPDAAASRAALAAIEAYVLGAQAEAHAVPVARAEKRVAELGRTAPAPPPRRTALPRSPRASCGLRTRCSRCCPGFSGATRARRRTASLPPSRAPPSRSRSRRCSRRGAGRARRTTDHACAVSPRAP